MLACAAAKLLSAILRKCLFASTCFANNQPLCSRSFNVCLSGSVSQISFLLVCSSQTHAFYSFAPYPLQNFILWGPHKEFSSNLVIFYS